MLNNFCQDTDIQLTTKTYINILGFIFSMGEFEQFLIGTEIINTVVPKVVPEVSTLFIFLLCTHKCFNVSSIKFMNYVVSAERIA